METIWKNENTQGPPSDPRTSMVALFYQGHDTQDCHSERKLMGASRHDFNCDQYAMEPCGCQSAPDLAKKMQRQPRQLIMAVLCWGSQAMTKLSTCCELQTASAAACADQAWRQRAQCSGHDTNAHTRVLQPPGRLPRTPSPQREATMLTPSSPARLETQPCHILPSTN